MFDTGYLFEELDSQFPYDTFDDIPLNCASPTQFYDAYNDDQTPQPLEEPPQQKKPPQTPKPQYEESTAIHTYLQSAQPPKKRREDKKTHELVK